MNTGGFYALVGLAASFFVTHLAIAAEDTPIKKQSPQEIERLACVRGLVNHKTYSILPIANFVYFGILYGITVSQRLGICRTGILKKVSEQRYRLSNPTMSYTRFKAKKSVAAIDTPVPDICFQLDPESVKTITPEDKSARHWCIYPSGRGILYLDNDGKSGQDQKYTHAAHTCAPDELNPKLEEKGD